MKKEMLAAAGAFVRSHLMTLALALCGVALAALILWLGFWKTLLIVALGAVGGAFGCWLDKRRGEKPDDGEEDYFYDH